METVAHVGEVVELLPELHVDFAVGHVAAGGDIEIVDGDPVFQPPGDVAGVAETGKILCPGLCHRQLGQDRDAVIALFATSDHVGITKRGKDVGGDLVDRALAFLQAQDVGGFLAHQPGDEVGAQADGIDVPGGDRKGHALLSQGWRRLRLAWPRARG